MNIWFRYLFRHLILSFLFFFCCILTLYTAIDLSINGIRFLSKDAISIIDIFVNYLRHFSKLFDLFASFSFLLATLKVLIDLNTHRELSALQIAGISAKRQLTPFFLLAALLTMVSYGNGQWVSPNAQQTIENGTNKKKKSKTEGRIFSVDLQDGSELIYQMYCAEKKELFDVFWIRSPTDLWYIKYLKVHSQPVQGRFAEHFIRNPDGNLEKIESLEHPVFPDLQWNHSASLQKFIPFEDRPLFLLLQQAASKGAEKQKSAAHLHYKLALPLVPFLMLLSIAPFAFRFSRGASAFLFASCCFFAYVGLRTLLDALLILAENQVFSPFIAIWGPLALCFAVSLYFFSQLR